MEKIDFKVELKDLFQPKKGTFTIVKVPKLNFLMVDGQGDPNTSKEYASAIELLYTLSYTLKFMSKIELKKDYTVPPLEGLWWADDMREFGKGNKKAWKWRAMIMLPDWITTKQVKDGIAAAKAKKPEVDFSRIRKEAYSEGLAVQTLFVGPYAKEAPVITTLHEEFMPENALIENGKHHEIYLSDPRKVAPEKLKTIIRQPVKKRTK